MSQALSGDLSHVRLSDMIKFMGAISASGRLLFTHEGRTAEAFVANGRVLHAVCGTARGLDALHEVLTWGAGRFDFTPGASTTEETIMLSPDAVADDMAARQDEFKRLREAFPTFDVIVRLKPASDAQELNFVPREWNVLIHVDGRHTVSDIARTVQLPAMETARILYGLVMTGLVEAEKVSRTRPAAAPPRPVPAAIEPMPAAVRPMPPSPILGRPRAEHEPATLEDTQPLPVGVPTIPGFTFGAPILPPAPTPETEPKDDDDSQSFDSLISSLKKK